MIQLLHTPAEIAEVDRLQQCLCRMGVARMVLRDGIMEIELIDDDARLQESSTIPEDATQTGTGEAMSAISGTPPRSSQLGPRAERGNAASSQSAASLWRRFRWPM